MSNLQDDQYGREIYFLNEGHMNHYKHTCKPSINNKLIICFAVVCCVLKPPEEVSQGCIGSLGGRFSPRPQSISVMVSIQFYKLLGRLMYMKLFCNCYSYSGLSSVWLLSS